MKHHEFYRRYKVTYPPLVNTVFSKKNWWLFFLMTILAILIEPLVMYKHHRLVRFSFEYYITQIEYFLFIFVPFFAFVLWTHWRELIKRKRGHSWVGKFEVTGKQTIFLFHYLTLSPGHVKLKVSLKLFEKIRQGDFVSVRKDALGKTEEVAKVKDVSSRLTSGRMKRLSRSIDAD